MAEHQATYAERHLTNQRVKEANSALAQVSHLCGICARVSRLHPHACAEGQLYELGSGVRARLSARLGQTVFVSLGVHVHARLRGRRTYSGIICVTLPTWASPVSEASKARRERMMCEEDHLLVVPSPAAQGVSAAGR